MTKATIKSKAEIAAMREGGKILGAVRDSLIDKVMPGVSAWEIEEHASKLIVSLGAEASFKKVPGYSYATCINVNSGVVHGIPKKETIFGNNDVVSIDVGVYYKGLHTDTAASKYLGRDKSIIKFIEAGKKALEAGISTVRAQGTVGDISKAYEAVLEAYNLNPIRSLTGHGVGRELHEDPFIPCFYSNSPECRVKLEPSMTLALEIMYTQGKGDLVLDNDGWTLRTKDGKISALFEETVLVMEEGHEILTK